VGGRKLNSVLHKNSNSLKLGESWEISGYNENISVVKEGALKGKSLNQLIDEYKEELLGDSVFKKFGHTFPLLVKFIDANQDLSVQLHPNDELAYKRHKSFGKTEMWYIIHADTDAELIIGFNQEVDQALYENKIAKGKLPKLLRHIPVQKGDSFFINAGTIHAIGAGILLAEIQQTSDITYRVYDWERKDVNGNSRELHTDLAFDAINYKSKDDKKLIYDSSQVMSELMRCDYFTTNLLKVKESIVRDLTKIDSFKIYICVKGSGTISINSDYKCVNLGDVFLIPAINKEVILMGNNMELLEVYI